MPLASIYSFLRKNRFRIPERGNDVSVVNVVNVVNWENSTGQACVGHNRHCMQVVLVFFSRISTANQLEMRSSAS